MNFFTVENPESFFRFLKWVAVIFLILLVTLTALGLVPTGVREFNNAFFNLFIQDEKPLPEEGDQSGAVPSVSLSLNMVQASTSQTASVSPTIPVKKPVQNSASVVATGALPVHIVIPKIGVDAQVLNPTSYSITAMDNALLSGAVRYPGSGTLTDGKTLFIFGHNTRLRVVKNQAFKTFNNLKDLLAGDEVRVDSKTHAYVYRVRDIQLTTADAGVVALEQGARDLVLVTCNTFGAKEERYIVHADFVESYPLTS